VIKLRHETRASPVYIRNSTRLKQNLSQEVRVLLTDKERFFRQVLVQILNECVRPRTEMVAA